MRVFNVSNLFAYVYVVVYLSCCFFKILLLLKDSKLEYIRYTTSSCVKLIVEA